jgi:hypothetical protein
MSQNSRGTRAVLLSAALLAAALAATPAADAASSKRCKALAGKAKVIVKGPDSLVVKRGSSDNFTLTYYGCLYVKPRLVKLPGQNGGDTEHFDKFTLSGRYLAYGHVNAEAAADHNPGWIELLDLQRRKRISQYAAFPVGPENDQTTGVLQILLRADGAVAWIGYKYGTTDTYSVQTALLGQATPAEVDQGIYVGRTSLRRVPDNPAAFSWRGRDGRQTAIFGGPTVTPQRARR